MIQILPHYFQKIKIDQIQVGKNRISLLYDKNIFYLDNDKFALNALLSYNPELKRVTVDLNRFKIKNSEIVLNGKFDFFLDRREWLGKGYYRAYDLNGIFVVSLNEDRLKFKLNSKETSSIKRLVDYIAPPEPIKVWIYPKIPAKKYKLHYLIGEIKIDDDNTIKFDPNKLKAFATAYEADIHFNSKVSPVLTKKIDIRLNNDTLSFKLYDPTYEGKKLNGSFVKIRNLTNSKAELLAHIEVNDKIDNSIKKLLSAYNINLPFVQTDGKTEAKVDFIVKLLTGSINRYEGVYKSEYAKLLFDNSVYLPVKNLNVISKGSKIIINQSNISLSPYLDANLSGSIDLNKRGGEFISLINRFQFDYNKVPLLKIKNRKVPIKLRFNDKVTFELPELNLIFSYIKSGSIKIVSKDIKPLIPYFQGPLIPIEDGKFEVEYSSKKLDATGFIKYRNNFLKYKNRKLQKFSFKLNRRNFETTVEVNKNIYLTLKNRKAIVNFSNLDIYVDKMLYILKDNLKKSNNKKSSQYTIHIDCFNTLLHYKKSKLSSKNLTIVLKTSPLEIEFITKQNLGEIRGIIKNRKLNIIGKGVSGSDIRNITSLDHIYGGYFDFNAVGTIDDFKGTISVRNSLWAKNRLLNNLLAILNTIPAVLTLQNPGFSDKGFKIKDGMVLYHYKDEILYFDKILINGDSAQITGRGKINLKSDTILMSIQIHFLENLTKLLNKIPIAGYIIFGNDGTMAVTLNISGYLDNPKVTTETVKDAVEVPLNILERTLKLPFKLFELRAPLKTIHSP